MDSIDVIDVLLMLLMLLMCYWRVIDVIDVIDVLLTCYWCYWCYWCVIDVLLMCDWYDWCVKSQSTRKHMLYSHWNTCSALHSETCAKTCMLSWSDCSNQESSTTDCRSTSIRTSIRNWNQTWSHQNTVQSNGNVNKMYSEWGLYP